MAAFGALAALEDHAERALHAALAMQRRLEPPLQLRIGVSTGDVVVGRAREASLFVTGDSVNGGLAGAGRRPGRDPGGRAHGRGGAGRVRIRRAAERGGEGEGRGVVAAESSAL